MIQDVSSDDPWKPIRVRMFVRVAEITSILPDTVHLAQGQRMKVPITIVSDAGPGTIVSYTLQTGQRGARWRH
jgi:hypothetical protein